MLSARTLITEDAASCTAGLFGSCHGSTIVVLGSGEILVAFFAGEKEGSADSSIWVSRRSAVGWELPEQVVRSQGVPLWNPVLHVCGGEIVLFYKRGETTQCWTTMVVRSLDGGHTWSRPAALVEGAETARGPARTKLAVLDGGAWLAGGSVEHGRRWDAFVDRSEDCGRTWVRSAIPLTHLDGTRFVSAERRWEGLERGSLWATDLDSVLSWDGVIQPTVWQSAGRCVHVLLRSTRGCIYRSDSLDCGRTWCEAHATYLPSNNSGVDVLRMRDGRLLLAYNPVFGNWATRTPLALSLSRDNGLSWSAEWIVQTGLHELSYPALVEVPDGCAITYTQDRRKIVYKRILIA